MSFVSGFTTDSLRSGLRKLVAVGIAAAVVGVTVQQAEAVGVAVNLQNGFEKQRAYDPVTVRSSALSGDAFSQLVTTGDGSAIYDANGARGNRELKVSGSTGVAYVQWNFAAQRKVCASTYLWAQQVPRTPEYFMVMLSGERVAGSLTWLPNGALGIADTSGKVMSAIEQPVVLDSWNLIEMCLVDGVATVELVSDESRQVIGRSSAVLSIRAPVSGVVFGHIYGAGNFPLWLDELTVKGSGSVATAPIATPALPRPATPPPRTTTRVPSATPQVPSDASKAVAPRSVEQPAAPAEQLPVSGRRLIWSDEFNSASLDTTKWATQSDSYSDECRGNHKDNKLEYNLPKNLSVANGVLNITAIRENYSSSRGENYSWTSGLITTGQACGEDPANGAIVMPGDYLSMRAKLPAALGMWPALWTWQDEVDVFEYHYDNPNLLELTNHTGGGGGSYYEAGTDLTAAWHDFGAYLGVDKVEWYLDGKLIGSGPPFVTNGSAIIVNMAVNNSTYHPEPNVDSAIMQVDWVHVYR